LVKLTGFTLGQYYPAESPVHRLDPRVKIALTFGLVAGLFLIKNFLGFLGAFLLISLVIYLGQLPFWMAFRGLKPLFYIFVFTMVVHFFFTAGYPLLRIGPLVVTREGFFNGLFISLRLLLLVLGSNLLIFTTSPIALTDGMEYLLSPLQIFRVPSHEIALMMTIALRFIPTLIVEAEKIIKAQMARGADFESGNLIRRARSYLPLLIPLFVTVFRRADELALAMESRCYRGGKGRTKFRELRIKRSDWVALALATVIIIAIVAIGRQ